MQAVKSPMASLALSVIGKTCALQKEWLSNSQVGLPQGLFHFSNALNWNSDFY